MFKSIFKFFGKLLKGIFKFIVWLAVGFLTPWGCIIRLLFVGGIVGLCVWIF